MHHLRDKDGKYIYDIKIITQQFMGIYLNLYTSKKSQSATTEKFLQNLNLSKVSAEHRNYIEQPITETEILQTVKKKKNPSRQTSHQAQTGTKQNFTNSMLTFSVHLLRACNYILTMRTLPTSWSKTTIITIPNIIKMKPNRHHLGLSHYLM